MTVEITSAAQVPPTVRLSKDTVRRALSSERSRRRESLQRRALEGGALPTGDDVEALERLDKLIDRSSWSAMWVAAGLLLAAAVPVILLLRVSDTYVDVRAEVSQLTFTPSQDTRISLRPWSSMDRLISLAPTQLLGAKQAGTVNEFDGHGLLSLAIDTKNARCRLSSSFVASADDQVTLGGGLGKLELEAVRPCPTCPPPSLDVACANDAPMTAAMNPSGTAEVDLPGASLVGGEETTRRGGSVLRLQVAARSDDARAITADLIEVKDLGFATQVRDELQGRPKLMPNSTIESGTILFKELKDREIKLRRHEQLELTVKKGVVYELEARTGGYAVAFRGWVSRLSTGDVQENLMPTRLEWLDGHRLLHLLWAAACVMAGLLFAAQRMWREVRP